MSIAFDICRETLKNAAMSFAPVRAWRLKKPRTSQPFDNSDAALERYALLPLQTLLASVGSVQGARILEIGPGDHLASGLAMLAAGAESYTAVDRFPGDYNSDHAKRWYAGVEAAWQRKFPQLAWHHSLRAANFPEGYPRLVKVLPTAIEDVNLSDSYDIICSFHVAEHVSNIQTFAEANSRLLSRDGKAVHLVDFGPHNWEKYADKLTFLKFPDWLWNIMGSARGVPNRFRFHEIKNELERAGLRVSANNIETLEAGITPHKLARRFRRMPPESLKIMTATFVCEKPSTASRESRGAVADTARDKVSMLS